MLSLASTSHRVATSVQCQRKQAFKAFYAVRIQIHPMLDLTRALQTIRSLRQQPVSDGNDTTPADNASFSHLLWAKKI